jgi:hypothetical protein
MSQRTLMKHQERCFLKRYEYGISVWCGVVGMVILFLFFNTG